MIPRDPEAEGRVLEKVEEFLAVRRVDLREARCRQGGSWEGDAALVEEIKKEMRCR